MKVKTNNLNPLLRYNERLLVEENMYLTIDYTFLLK